MKFEEPGRKIYCKDNNIYNTDKIKRSWKGYLIHRENGPAIEWDNGDRMWYLNGIRYSEEDYLKMMNLKNKYRVLYEI